MSVRCLRTSVAARRNVARVIAVLDGVVEDGTRGAVEDESFAVGAFDEMIAIQGVLVDPVRLVRAEVVQVEVCSGGVLRLALPPSILSLTIGRDLQYHYIFFFLKNWITFYGGLTKFIY